MGQDEIRPFDGDLTFVGKLMAELPINIELSRLIALGHAFGLVYEAVVIVACLSRKKYF
jgi:ATP-dependent RNA helicase TDRD9